MDAIDVSRGLRIINNNATVYAKLLNRFISNTLYKEFTDAVASGDNNTVRERAHALKGVAANLGLAQITDIIVPIEAALKADSTALPSKEDMETLEAAYVSTIAAIKIISAQPEILERYK